MPLARDSHEDLYEQNPQTLDNRHKVWKYYTVDPLQFKLIFLDGWLNYIIISLKSFSPIWYREQRLSSFHHVLSHRSGRLVESPPRCLTTLHGSTAPEPRRGSAKRAGKGRRMMYRLRDESDADERVYKISKCRHHHDQQRLHHWHDHAWS